MTALPALACCPVPCHRPDVRIHPNPNPTLTLTLTPRVHSLAATVHAARTHLVVHLFQQLLHHVRPLLPLSRSLILSDAGLDALVELVSGLGLTQQLVWSRCGGEGCQQTL